MDTIIETALKYAKEFLFDLSLNVVSVGLGYKITGGEPSERACIVVGVSQKLAKINLSIDEIIPSHISGIVTDVIEVGAIRALDFDPKIQHRPAPGGVSIGNINTTAGTLGCLVKHNQEVMILSNWHVFCAGDPPGTPILQPGTYDGGELETDKIGELLKAVPIVFEDELDTECPITNGLAAVFNFLSRLFRRRSRVVPYADPENSSNLVDAAIAKVTNPGDVVNRIEVVGKCCGIEEGILGMAVQKYGRTTEHTRGAILQTHASVRVQYGGDRIAVFDDQLITGNMSAGGDSGSIVVTYGSGEDYDPRSNKVVGLLFAGSDKSTIINRIQHVFDLLDLELLE